MAVAHLLEVQSPNEAQQWDGRVLRQAQLPLQGCFTLRLACETQRKEGVSRKWLLQGALADSFNRPSSRRMATQHCQLIDAHMTNLNDVQMAVPERLSLADKLLRAPDMLAAE